MKKQRRFFRTARSYQRRPPRIVPSGHTFLVVTEGEKTEKNYLDVLRTRLQLSASDVRIVHPEGTDPLTLTRAAIELRDERAVAAKKGLAVAYDEVWVVFDLEQTHDERRRLAEQAKQLPEAAELRFAHSDPCFEYWLLIHVEDTASAFKDCLAVIRQLKKYWPDYSKNQPPSADFLENLPQAVGRARLRRKNLEALGEIQHPFTDIDLLVSALNVATRPHLQITLTTPPAPRPLRK